MTQPSEAAKDDPIETLCEVIMSSPEQRIQLAFGQAPVFAVRSFRRRMDSLIRGFVHAAKEAAILSDRQKRAAEAAATISEEDIVQAAMECGIALSTLHGQDAGKLMPISDHHTLAKFAAFFVSDASWQPEMTPELAKPRDDAIVEHAAGLTEPFPEAAGSEVTSEQLDEWQRLADAATIAPWDWEPHGQNDEALFAGPSEKHGFAIHRLNILNCGADWDHNGANNKAFIASARTAVPLLIAEVRRLAAHRSQAVADAIEPLMPPKCYQNQGCTLSARDMDVTISCDNIDDREAMFDWLCRLSAIRGGEGPTIEEHGGTKG